MEKNIDSVSKFARFVTIINSKIGRHSRGKELIMLWTIFVILVVLWLLGFFTGYTVGGFLHVLLVIAIIMLLVNIFQGRKSRS